MRGAARAALIDALTGQGLDAERAEREVDAILGSPVFAGARAVMGRAAGLEQAARLCRHFQGQHALELDGHVDDARFWREAWTAHRPVVLRGAARAWPRWTLGDLRARFGSASIEVLRGRASTPRWWTRREALQVRMPLAELLDRMDGPASDDVYGVARNGIFEDLPELLAEIGTMPGIRADAPHARLWIGPAGTHTPSHHDQSSAWLVQRVGTKRVWLASPLEASLMDHTDGVFNRADPRLPADGELAEVRWSELLLEPDDAVFLPAGWWHQVVAESASVSVSLGGFRWHHDVGWYAPGRYGG